MGVLAGAALVRGRPVRVRRNLRYSTQPWADPKRAVRDGVAVIPPLTTPTGPAGTPPRTDIVYLDVWEREVGSDEDANLINPAIGVETCVRLKREAAVRVAEGTTELPPAPAGHVFLPLARLLRPPNQAEIFLEHIEDIRLFFHSPQGSREVSFFPAFLPVYTIPAITPSSKLPEWRTMFSPIAAGGSVPKFRAIKEQNEAATGVLPLILPDRAVLTSLGISGDISATNGQVRLQLLRINHQVPTAVSAEQFFDVLYEDTKRSLSGQHIFSFTGGFSVTGPKLIVDNSRYYYALLASTFATPAYGASIHGVSIHYEYFGLMGRPEHEHD